jgi:hypothetical protein
VLLDARVQEDVSHCWKHGGLHDDPTEVELSHPTQKRTTANFSKGGSYHLVLDSTSPTGLNSSTLVLVRVYQNGNASWVVACTRMHKNKPDEESNDPLDNSMRKHLFCSLVVFVVVVYAGWLYSIILANYSYTNQPGNQKLTSSVWSAAVAVALIAGVNSLRGVYRALSAFESILFAFKWVLLGNVVFRRGGKATLCESMAPPFWGLVEVLVPPFCKYSRQGTQFGL